MNELMSYLKFQNNNMWLLIPQILNQMNNSLVLLKAESMSLSEVAVIFI